MAMANETITKPRTGAELPQRLHHNAYVCADQERTRHFYEDILGLPLIATWIERAEMEGRTANYSHTFYGLGDGGALAFFNFQDPELQARFTPKAQPAFVHIALKVSPATQDEIRGRCEAAQVATRTLDHGYCTSLYVTDPDGLTVEFTRDVENVDAINTHQRATAHAALARWLAGDTTPNNDVRPH
jgi:catechol 2,3-dioxygenase-like lactoylglutathione lyase family enzyme